MSQNLSLPKKRKQQKIKGLPPRVGRRRDPRDPKKDKYADYRRRVGKPNGPGQPGNKSGRNATS